MSYNDNKANISSLPIINTNNKNEKTNINENNNDYKEENNMHHDNDNGEEEEKEENEEDLEMEEVKDEEGGDEKEETKSNKNIYIQNEEEKNNYNYQNNNSKINNNIINNENEEDKISYKIKMESLKKENSELKANINKKQDEITKLSKLNSKLRKNLEQVSSQVDTLLKKVNDNAINPKKKKNISENTINNYPNSVNINETGNLNNIDKDSLSKDMQLKNSLTMIHYLTKDNKKLKKQIETLNQITPNDMNALESIRRKENEITLLNNENRKLKDEINQYKYAEKTIENLKKKINNLNDTIKRLNDKIFSMKDENEKNQNLKRNLSNNNSSINIKENNQNISIIKENNNLDYLKVKNKIKNNNKLLNNTPHNNLLNKKLGFRQRSSSLTNIRNDNIQYKNFYKLFNENEQKAISTLFSSEEDLNNFKQKIIILENRNQNSEKLYTKEINDLKKLINEKDDHIKYLNSKIHENEVKFKILQSKSKEKMNNNLSYEKKEKKINVEQQLKEFGYVKNIRNKNEQIEKLNNIINNLKEEINKNHIEKSKEKELNDLKNEIGKIEIVDLKNILPNIKLNCKQSFLKIKRKEIQIYIKGKNNSNLINNKHGKSSGKDNKKVYSIYSGSKNNSQNKKKYNNNINNVVSLSLSRGKKK